MRLLLWSRLIRIHSVSFRAQSSLVGSSPNKQATISGHTGRIRAKSDCIFPRATETLISRTGAYK